MMKAIIKYTLLTLCGLLLFFAAKEAETVRRGYAAIGGESVFIFLPILCRMVETTVKDITRLIRGIED